MPYTFHGISLVNNLKATFYWSSEGRKEEDHQYKKYTVPMGSQTFQLLSGCNIDRIGIKDDVTFEVLLDEYLVDFN